MTDFTPEGEDLTVCRFPKHEGKTWLDVLEEDRPYIEWLVFEFLDNGPLYDHLMDLLEEQE